MTKAPSHVMTPGRAIILGTIPARPGPRCGTARGSVSGVCPEASRRPAGGSNPYRSGAFCLRILRVSPLNLARRPNAERRSDRPAFFPFRSAAVPRLTAPDRRRPSTSAQSRAGRRHQFQFRASARRAGRNTLRAMAQPHRPGHGQPAGACHIQFRASARLAMNGRAGDEAVVDIHAQAGITARQSMADKCSGSAGLHRQTIHHPRCDVADALPFVSAHRAPPKSALRPPRQELRRCASEAPSPDAPPICRNQIGSKGSPRCRTFSPRSRRSSPRAVA